MQSQPFQSLRGYRTFRRQGNAADTSEGFPRRPGPITPCERGHLRSVRSARREDALSDGSATTGASTEAGSTRGVTWAEAMAAGLHGPAASIARGRGPGPRLPHRHHRRARPARRRVRRSCSTGCRRTSAARSSRSAPGRGAPGGARRAAAGRGPARRRRAAPATGRPAGAGRVAAGPARDRPRPADRLRVAGHRAGRRRRSTGRRRCYGRRRTGGNGRVRAPDAADPRLAGPLVAGRATGARSDTAATRPGPTPWAGSRPGVAVAVDYGHVLPDRPPERVARRLPRGRRVAPAPDADTDVTAHVAWDAVAEAVGRAVPERGRACWRRSGGPAVAGAECRAAAAARDRRRRAAREPGRPACCSTRRGSAASAG